MNTLNQNRGSKEKKPSNQPLRVGFDFDGVILYNPARILRPFLTYLRGKKTSNGQNKLVFYHPKGEIKRVFWWLAHQSSLFPAKGLQEVYEMIQLKKIEGHIVTGRSTYLKSDFERRLRSIKANQYMASWNISENDEQPHEFKQRMIEELKLDCYVEDNWSIAQYLSKHTSAKIFWISNVADFHFDYSEKYLHFHQVVARIKELV